MNALQDSTVEIMKRMHHATERCIRCARYFQATSGKTLDFFKFSQNCFGELAIMHWATLFGNENSESTHFKIFFSRKDVLDVLETNDLISELKADFLSRMEFSEDQYQDFWCNACRVRNRFIAHRDELSDLRFPDVLKMSVQCFVLRKYMQKVLTRSISDGDCRSSVCTLSRYYSENGSEDLYTATLDKSIEDAQTVIS